MRWLASLIVTVLCTCSVQAEPETFNAGVIRLTVADEAATPDTVVFYPTHERETPWQAGPFVIDATRDASPIADRRFPVVLISHGRGRGAAQSS